MRMPSLRLLKVRRAAFARLPRFRPPALSGRNLLDFPSTLLPVPFPGKSCLDPFFLSRLQIERMPLDLFNDVFLLHLTFESPEGIFKSFALLESDFRQINTPPNRIWFYFVRSTTPTADEFR
jgi:hypothetical protein